MKELNENYLFIPPAVRYCHSLPPNAKILFGEIAARANEEGEAIFGYDELAEMFNASKKSVYFWVTALEEEGFILSRMDQIKKVHFRAFLLVLKPADFEE